MGYGYVLEFLALGLHGFLSDLQMAHRVLLAVLSLAGVAAVPEELLGDLLLLLLLSITTKVNQSNLSK